MLMITVGGQPRAVSVTEDDDWETEAMSVFKDRQRARKPKVLRQAKGERQMKRRTR